MRNERTLLIIIDDGQQAHEPRDVRVVQLCLNECALQAEQVLRVRTARSVRARDLRRHVGVGARAEPLCIDGRRSIDHTTNGPRLVQWRPVHHVGSGHLTHVATLLAVIQVGEEFLSMCGSHAIGHAKGGGRVGDVMLRLVVVVAECGHEPISSSGVLFEREKGHNPTGILRCAPVVSTSLPEATDVAWQSGPAAFKPREGHGAED
mmetsp:Transcript_45300/g.114049  ORF Transcript_45300/g.114049 Transcript_45300/m.114049 type:complete len:206 (+) Transcript_45300:148-765(+)